MSRRLIIVIIIIAIVIVSGGVWYWLKSANPPKRMVFKTQEECEKITEKKCSFGMCDYKCPNNDYWKGWAPTGEKINKVVCDYDNPNKRYFYKTINECSVVKYKCEEGRSFSDDCGCGCEVVSSNFCPELKNMISKKIKEANFCNNDSDCVILKGIGCPFGCGNYVNKNYNIEELLKNYESYNICPDYKCEYICELPGIPICVNKKCIDSGFIK